MALQLKHQTAAEFAARLRAAYKSASKERAAVLSKFILDRLASGDITDAQMRSVFGLTNTQWNNLKTEMTNLVANHTAVVTAEGK